MLAIGFSLSGAVHYWLAHFWVQQAAGQSRDVAIQILYDTVRG